MVARVAPSAGGGPPALPPRLRKLLAGGAAALNTGGRAKSWLQTGTHRTGNLGNNVQLYCMLLPSDGNTGSPSPAGPLTVAEVASMIYSAEVVDGTPVWTAGMGGWQRCSDCIARFSWPSPDVDDRSPLAGGRVASPSSPMHVHERLSPQARDSDEGPEDYEASASVLGAIGAARELIKVAGSLPQPEPEPEPAA